MSRSLIIALTLSLVLHGSLLMTNGFRLAPLPRGPALRATLRPPVETNPPETDDALLKNTFDDERERSENPVSPPPPEKHGTSAPADVAKRQMDAVRRKLSEYVFYPEQAKKLGIEGTVTLFVELSSDGRVEDVRVVESSGYPILDHAAVRGFYAVGRLPGESDYWEYSFRLE
jgi:protein TonB